MAGIIKRANSWVAVIKVGGGKEVRISTRVPVSSDYLKPGETLKASEVRNQAAARAVAYELEKKYQGYMPDVRLVESIIGEQSAKALLEDGFSPCLSTDAYLQKWLKRREFKTRALERDGKAVRQFLAWLGSGKNMPLDKINAGMVREFMEKELERVSSGTVTRYLTTLACAFNHAIESQFISVNPFKKILPSKRERCDKQERSAFSIEEVRRMVEEFPDEWPDMIRVCLYTGGQRLGDIAKLTWEQIDLENGILNMTTEKTKRRMNKPIIAPLHDIFQRRSRYRMNSHVFPIAAMRHAQAGGKSSKLSLEFTALLRKHGFIGEREVMEGDRRQLSEKSFHSLRATAVTVLRLSGVSADLCRFIVGHDSEEIERQYIRPQFSDIAGAMDVLARGLSAAV